MATQISAILLNISHIACIINGEYCWICLQQVMWLSGYVVTTGYVVYNRLCGLLQVMWFTTGYVVIWLQVIWLCGDLFEISIEVAS